MTTGLGALLVVVMLAAVVQPGRARPQGSIPVADQIPTQGVQVLPDNEAKAFQHQGSSVRRSSDVTFLFPAGSIGGSPAIGQGFGPSLSPADITGQAPVLSVDGPGTDDVQFRFPIPSSPIDGSLSNVGSPGTDDVQFRLPDPSSPLDVSLSNVGFPGTDDVQFRLPNPSSPIDGSFSNVGAPGSDDVQLAFPDPAILVNGPFLGQDPGLSSSPQSKTSASGTSFPGQDGGLFTGFEQGTTLKDPVFPGVDMTAGQGPFPDPAFDAPVSNQDTAQFDGTKSTPSLDYPSFPDPKFDAPVSSQDTAQFGGSGSPPSLDYSSFPDPTFDAPVSNQDTVQFGGGGSPPSLDYPSFPDPTYDAPVSNQDTAQFGGSVADTSLDYPSISSADMGAGFSNTPGFNTDEMLIEVTKSPSQGNKLLSLLTFGLLGNQQPSMGDLLSKSTFGVLGNRNQGSSGNSQPLDLSVLSSGQNMLGSLVQAASSGIDDIARESSSGLKVIGDELQFMTREQLQQIMQNLQQTGRTLSNVGQNTYRSLLQQKDSIGKLLMDTVGNLGRFANTALSKAFENVGNTVTGTGTFIRDLKVGLLNSLISKGEAVGQLFTDTLETTGNAFNTFTSAAQGAAEDNIRAITGIETPR